MENENAVGESWKPFYRKGNLSWYDPKKADRNFVQRFSESEWITRLLALSEIPLQGRILEAGCGTGMYSVALSLLGYRLEAFDYNEEALQIAEDLAGRVFQGESPVKFYQNNLLKMTAGSNTYDLVFNQAVLEYFNDPSDRKKIYREMARAAKPGGAVAVMVQHTAHPFRKFWEKMGWRGYADQPPVTLLDAKTLKNELEEAGLRTSAWMGFILGKPCFSGLIGRGVLKVLKI